MLCELQKAILPKPQWEGMGDSPGSENTACSYSERINAGDPHSPPERVSADKCNSEEVEKAM